MLCNKGDEFVLASYKIAVIIEEINQSYQSSILNGIASSAAEFDLNISAFISFSGALDNPRHDTGEFNIFNLPDFSDFDGAILLTNTLAYQPVVNDILARIKAAGIPAVSIDNDIPYLYHIGIDNKTAMRQITEHMIKKHGFTKFAYISGPQDNPESADRMSAFLEVLKENNISVNDDYIYYGDFRAPSGRAAVESLLSKADGLPQAIICANDVMAASAINRLSDEGLSVPDDIAVTGFDNTYSNHNYQVELTSVERPLSLSGRLACKMLYNHFNNLSQKRNIILNMSAKFTESCGCCENILSDISEFKKLNYRNYLKFQRSQDYSMVINKLSCDLLACNTFHEYIDSLKKFVVSIDPEEFYFCLCENWDSDSAVDITSSDVIGNINIPDKYTEDMIAAIAYVRGEFYQPHKIASRSIIPSIADNDGSGKFYYVIPLHFAERCLGYMVILNAKIPLHNSMFETFCISVSNSLENIRKLICLEYAVDRLGKLYVQDTFSGIYNRNGFIQATAQQYHECVTQGKEVMLMFIDLDGLKKINDTYGHSVGDNAIRNVADVLRQSCVNGEVYCRFGGDEFIVFGADYTEHSAKQLTDTILQNIEAINESKINPFKLSASTGYVIAVPTENEDIFDFVTDADKKMYYEKRKKKLSKYLKG